MPAIATRSIDNTLANLELGENKEEDEHKRANNYVRSAILLVLFNIACITLFIFVYELSAWNEKRVYQILKVSASLVGIIGIVMFARMEDFSKNNFNFYYI